MSTTSTITYYCHKRKALFKRKVLIDGPEEQRRIATAVFATRAGDNHAHPTLIVQRIRGQLTCRTGESASVPALLFGPEYHNARRVDSSSLWDFRKEAFECLSMRDL